MLRVLCCVLFLGASAQADTIKVSSGVAADLQAAIDGAADGDVISVSGGPYEGNFVIPFGKNDLTIKGKATIDAYEGNHAFEINGHGAVISGLVIRHSKSTAIDGPFAGGPGLLLGLTVENCRFVNCEGPALFVEGNDVVVSGCVLESCSGGIDIDGNRAIVTKTSILGDGFAGIFIEGNDAQVSKCVLTQIQDNEAILIEGDEALVSGCKISNTDSDAITVSGDDAVVEGNSVEDVGFGRGVNVFGNRAMLTKNKVHGTVNSGLFVIGTHATVLKNVVEAVKDDGHGFDITSTTGARIEGNTATGVNDGGFNMEVGGATISKNKAVRCGADQEVGFELIGNNNGVEGNTAQDCGSSGFRVTGNGNTLDGNQAKGNNDNGFRIEGLTSAGNTLAGNSAKSNEGEGIENGGLNTTLTGNTCSKNLLDIANETLGGANIVDGGGNKFTTGGFTSNPEVD